MFEQAFQVFPCAASDRVRVTIRGLMRQICVYTRIRPSDRVNIPKKPRFQFFSRNAVDDEKMRRRNGACRETSSAGELLQLLLQHQAIIVITVYQHDHTPIILAMLIRFQTIG